MLAPTMHLKGINRIRRGELRSPVCAYERNWIRQNKTLRRIIPTEGFCYKLKAVVVRKMFHNLFDGTLQNIAKFVDGVHFHILILP